MLAPGTNTLKIWSWITIVGSSLVVANMVYYTLMLVICYFFYRSKKPLSDAALPACTVVIPAYNEGRSVYKTIESALNSDYPTNLLKVVVVDDGSEDDTWNWITLAQKKYSERVLTVKHPKNQGKRHAIVTGVENSESEFIITLDSDSTVTEGAFRALISHFEDANVGAVAGNLRVGNLSDGIIPRMLDVCFVFNFDVMRSSQSVFGCVLCTPGALSAYRCSMLKEFLSDWLEESFLGVKAGIGEDRSLATNLLVRGHQVHFERQALAYTQTPTKYRDLCRMILRWCRGDVRETVKMYRFIFNNLSIKQLVILVNVLMQTAWFVTPFFCIVGIVAMQGSSLLAMYAAVVLWATLPAILYAKKAGANNGVWAYCYAIFYICFMSWIIPYSIASVRNSKWMTRTIAPKSINLQLD